MYLKTDRITLNETKKYVFEWIKSLLRICEQQHESNNEKKIQIKIQQIDQINVRQSDWTEKNKN
jgi:hypothetical protein